MISNWIFPLGFEWSLQLLTNVGEHLVSFRSDGIQSQYFGWVVVKTTTIQLVKWSQVGVWQNPDWIPASTTGLVYFAISLLRLLSDVESQLATKNSALMGQYAQGLGLCIVALLRRYLPCLLVSPENTSQVGRGKSVKDCGATSISICSLAKCPLPIQLPPPLPVLTQPAIPT